MSPISVLICAVLLAQPRAARPSTTPAWHVAPESLVAEAYIREVGNDRHAIYLPVTIQGHRGTILVYFFQTSGVDLLLSSAALTTLGVTIPPSGSLDTVMIGTTVAPNLRVQVGAMSSSDLDVQTDQSPAVSTFTQSDLPPVIGMAGNDFLERYDWVIDGPHRRVRLYAPARHAAASGPHTPTLGQGLPPGLRAADCRVTRPMPEGHVGFLVQANGQPVTATLQTLFGGLTIMNLVTAHHLGLTQHSPNVHVIPDSVQTHVYQGVPDKYAATDIHVTLGRYAFRTVPVHVLARAPLQPTDTTPAMELTLENVLDQVFVASYSTGQVCLSR